MQPKLNQFGKVKAGFSSLTVRSQNDWSLVSCYCLFFNDTATTEIYTLSLHDALPIYRRLRLHDLRPRGADARRGVRSRVADRSEEHTSELQSRLHLVCRLLLEKKKKKKKSKNSTKKKLGKATPK